MRNKQVNTCCVGTGFIVLDVIRSPVDENTTLERRYAGGSCANVLSILSFFGLSSIAVGRIGDDTAGGELVSDLRRWHVDTKHLATEIGRRTPVVIQESYADARGRMRHRFSRECPLCGATMPAYRPLLVPDVTNIADALPQHRIFFFDRVASGTLELARQSRRQGALVIFEPSGVKEKDLFVECLRTAHVLKYSQERFSDLDEFVDLVDLPLEIRTLGAKGLQFRNSKSKGPKSWRSLPALEAPTLRDAAGSGDWCTAGFIFEVLQHKHPALALSRPTVVAAALRFGQALAALNCAYDGARGLMYATTRDVAEKAAGKILANDEPQLPVAAIPFPTTHYPESACIVCSSSLH